MVLACLLAASALPALRFKDAVEEPSVALEGRGRPCCSLPCLHGAPCAEANGTWRCQCEGTGHHGRTCHVASWGRWFADLAGLAGLAFEPAHSTPGRARLLPPVPAGCPTPMGVEGPRPLPSEDDVFEALLARPVGAFEADPSRANLLLVAFVHHFLYQLHGGLLHVDAGQVYGSAATCRLLRAPAGGRLLSRVVDGQEFPSCVEDAAVPTAFSRGLDRGQPARRRLPYFHLTGPAPDHEVEPRWALGHPMLTSTPLVFAVAVLWLREHNRVADLLAAAHPRWHGDRLFETARRVVTAEMVLVALRELLPRLQQGRGAPPLQWPLPVLAPRAAPPPTPLELPVARFWGWQLPDALEVDGRRFNMTDLMFTNQRLVVERGVRAVVDAAVRQAAGKATLRNCGRLVKGWTKRLLRDARLARLQPFNRYRQLLGLPPARSFLDLAGDELSARRLRRLYGHVDAVELLPGLLAERRGPGAMLPPSLEALSALWLRTAALSSPLGPPWTWTPRHFGGEAGWAVVAAASLQTLVCANVEADPGRPCQASWTVPPPRPAPTPASCSVQLGGDASASLACALTEQLQFVVKAAVA